MHRSRDRILTTHAGSLPRPSDLLEMIQARAEGRPHDREGYARRVRTAVAEVVRRQVEHGLDVIDDGEMGKPSFVTYVTERLTGFEPSGEPGGLPWAGSKEVLAFPEFYAPSLRQSPNAAARPFVCRGPVSYQGHAQVQADIANLKAALAGDEASAQAQMDGKDGNTAYVNAKHALALGVRRRAAEWGAAGVRLNAVLPGKIATPMLAKIHAHALLGPSIEALPVPLGREATPEEVAGPIAFLLGPDSRYVHGAMLHVGGGADALVRPDAL